MYEQADAIVFERPKKAVFKQIRLATVDDDTIVVETQMSGISSGTDMKTWLGLQNPANNVYFPLVPGYEAMGKIVYLGKNRQGGDLAIGDRVMANECRYYPDQCAAWGGNARYIIKNPQTSCEGMNAVAKIPDNVSNEEAVVAYLACVAKRGIDKVGVSSEENVLVTGMGNVGLSAVQLFKIRGAKKVIALDIEPTRLALAKKFADHVVDGRQPDAAEQVRDLCDRDGVDVIFECSGNPVVLNQMPDFLRSGGWTQAEEGGRIHLQGDYPSPMIIDQYYRWFSKNCSISMSCAFREGDKDSILELIRSGQFDAKSLYSKIMPVEQVQEAYEELYANRYDLLKILFQW